LEINQVKAYLWADDVDAKASEQVSSIEQQELRK